ncbi:hypothetical protein TNCV_554621 [Trichonephila clavipes]|nr:hypothetical protein TNCV_554621 [Trichonephila clavipes]
MQKLLLLSQFMKNCRKMIEDVNIQDTLRTPKITRSEKLKAVETTLEYFERQGALLLCSFAMKQQNAECITTDDFFSRVFIESSALERVIDIHSGMAGRVGRPRQQPDQASGDILSKSCDIPLLGEYLSEYQRELEA